MAQKQPYNCMNSFTVSTLVTKKDYIAYLITTLYKKPLTIITFILSAKFNAIPSMKHEIVYTFSEDLIVIKASTCDSTMQWSHFIKVRETKKFLLLLATKRTASLVDKTKLTQEQIQFIKSKIVKK